MAPTATKAPTEEKYRPERSASRTLASRGDLTPGGPRPYPAKLTALYETEGDFGPQMYMELERDDEVWSDTGEPSVKRQWLSLTDSDGNPIWEGSDTDRVAQSFEEITGIDFFSDEAESLLGTHFMVQDEDTGRTTKKDKKIYVTVFIDNLGTDFKFEGKVRTRRSDNDTGPGTEPEALSDEEVAAYIASLFAGQSVEELRGGLGLDIVKNDEALAEVKTVLGKSLRGGLVRPKSVLIDALFTGGFASETDGVFVAHIGDIPFE